MVGPSGDRLVYAVAADRVELYGRSEALGNFLEILHCVMQRVSQFRLGHSTRQTPALLFLLPTVFELCTPNQLSPD
jgi:hypothetical protein